MYQKGKGTLLDYTWGRHRGGPGGQRQVSDDQKALSFHRGNSYTKIWPSVPKETNTQGQATLLDRDDERGQRIKGVSRIQETAETKPR